jgi:hypothetical protein
VVAGSWVASEADGHSPAPLDSVLVRPDGYVAWAAPGAGDLSGALGRWFGSTRATASV